MLDLAEQRSKALGMTSTNKFPLAEYNQEASSSTTKNQNSPKKSTSPTKCSVLRKESNSLMSKNTSQRMSSADAKENVDVALEINITTGPNVQVSFELFFSKQTKSVQRNSDRFKWKLKSVKSTSMAIFAVARKMRPTNALQ